VQVFVFSRVIRVLGYSGRVQKSSPINAHVDNVDILPAHWIYVAAIPEEVVAAVPTGSTLNPKP